MLCSKSSKSGKLWSFLGQRTQAGLILPAATDTAQLNAWKTAQNHLDSNVCQFVYSAPLLPLTLGP